VRGRAVGPVVAPFEIRTRSASDGR
jgi:hypothetical protein